MKKIAGILICIAIAFSFAGCSWQIPQKVSVKTNADYNFSLGNFEKDFSSELNVSRMIGDLQLPNNGKVYDYWPEKKGDTQSFLMYMPIQEIPIDISKYFAKGAIAEKISNISFEKEIQVPEVKFSFPVEFSLDKVNEEINKKFVLAGPIGDYENETGEFGRLVSRIAESITYEKGFLVIKAYSLGGVDPRSITSLQNVINENDIDTSYNGSVTITSGGKPISGSFDNGVAVLEIPRQGFEFKSTDISISFSNKPSIGSIPTKAFIAKFDTNREYQIKKISGIGSEIAIPKVPIPEQEISSLKSISGLEECKIGEGSVTLDFNIPEEWSNISLTYDISLEGGINLSTRDLVTSGRQNKNIISLNNQSISAETVKVNAEVSLVIAGATIDFTKPPTIAFDSNISRIDTVTVKLSDTQLSFVDSQKLPNEALDILKSITISKCGIEGTYTNTLPGGVDNAGNPINAISMTVSSNFFGIEDNEIEIRGGAEDEPLEFFNSEDENYVHTIELTKEDPAPSGKFNAIDFDVGVTLPGGDRSKVTVRNVEPGKTYKLAISVTPVINWKSVELDTSTLPSADDKIATGFNPSSIFNSIDEVMGNGFSNNIDIPDCNLYLYLTKPNLEVFESLTFEGSSISMYYGKEDKIKIGDYEKAIITDGQYTDTTGTLQNVTFVEAAPTFNIEKIDEEDVVTSKLFDDDASLVLPISDLLEPNAASSTEGAQLCIDYEFSLAGIAGENNTLTITEEELDNASAGAGSIGIYAVIELPLSFRVAANTSIKLQNLIYQNDSEESEDNDKDLFGRSEASGFDEIKKYLDVIEAARIQYRLDSFPIETSNDISLNLELCNGFNQTVFSKELTFDTDDT